MSWGHSCHCDVCGKERGESNHWWTAVIDGNCDLVRFYAWEKAVDEGLLQNENTLHLCGQRCAHKVLDDLMTHYRNTP